MLTFDRLLATLFSPAVPARLAVVATYIRLRALSALAPTGRAPVRLLGYRVHYGSRYILWNLYEEIFLGRRYWHKATSQRPRIVDAGANIGLSTLYYKYLFPDAEIACIEPDPTAYDVLAQNVADNGLEGVTLHRVALSDQEGRERLYFDAALPTDPAQSLDQRFRQAFHAKQLSSVEVETRRLSDFLSEPVDVLKLNIEGNEVLVLQEARSCLHRVRAVHVEYHYVPDRNRLGDLLSLLEEAGFAYTLRTDGALTSEEGSMAMIRAERA